MSLMTLSEGFYWPYEEGVPTVRYQLVRYLGYPFTLPDGNTFLFGSLERLYEISDNSVFNILYFCHTTPHTHTDRPSCSRLVLRFKLSNGTYY